MNELDYKDTLRLVKTYVDGYHTEHISDIAEVPGLFMQSTGWEHGNHQSAITSDASAYIDFNHSFVTANFNRLEGMRVIYNPLGIPDADAWYRIERVVVGQDKLLGNEIDNVQIFLKKSSAIQEAS
jgi:hypothetical protein